MSTSGGAGGASPVSVATATILAAGINTLFSAPTALIAAPGANRSIIVDDFTVEAVTGGAGSWGSITDLGLYYGAAADVAAAAGLLTSLPAMLAGNQLPSGGEIATAPSNRPNTQVSSGMVNKAIIVGSRNENPTKIGALTAVTIADGGAGYAPGDTGTVDQDFYGGNAAYIVTTVGALGVVTGLTITAGGTGYAAGDASGTTPGGSQPGIGTGLDLTLTAVVAPTGTLYVTALYRTITTH